MRCPYCGANLEVVDNFCTNCGKPLRQGYTEPMPVQRPASVPPASASPQVSQPASAGQAHVPAHARRRSWGSPLSVALCVCALVLLVFSVVCLVAAPLIEVTLFTENSEATDEVIQGILTTIDPALSVALSDVIATPDMNIFALASTVPDLADVIGSVNAAVACGLIVGFIVVAAVLCIVGVVLTLVERRSSIALIVGSIWSVIVGAGLFAACYGLDDTLRVALRDTLSAPFAEMGLQLPASLQVCAPTIWMLICAIAAAIVLILAIWARTRTRPQQIPLDILPEW